MESNRRKKPSTTNSWPDDIISDILLKSAVKSLLRFKCLSKHWYSLITNPSFISNHLRHSNLKQHSAILTYRFDLYRDGVSLFFADESFLHDDMLFPQHSKHNPNVVPMKTVMGSSNGLVLLGNIRDYILWNPATRQSRRLPSPFNRWPAQALSATGFGYVPELNDYKLLRFLRVVDHSVGGGILTTKADVFSMKTGCWKQIENVPHCSCGFRDDSVTINGVWYHLMDHKDDDDVHFILFFEFKDEVFGKIELPHGFQKQCTKLLVYRESLTVVASESETAYIWIMKNNSWTKVITIGIGPFFSFKFVIGTWSNTKFLVTKSDSNNNSRRRGNNLLLYDPLKQTWKEVATEGEVAFFKALNYVESLVSVDEPLYF